MITAQNIREMTFEKAVMGGYNMGSVDEFLDQMAADFAAMGKENAALKGKMRVLVEKIEEYRQTEDSMRLALLSAQKMSADIEAEARKKAESIVSAAQQKADAITKDVRDNIDNERRKLEEAQKATQRFIDHMTAVCNKQLDFYEKLAEARLVGAEPAPAPAREPADAAAAAAPRKRRTPPVAEPVAEEGEEDEPTRMFAADAAKKKKRPYEEFRFGDED